MLDHYSTLGIGYELSQLICEASSSISTKDEQREYPLDSTSFGSWNLLWNRSYTHKYNDVVNRHNIPPSITNIPPSRDVRDIDPYEKVIASKQQVVCKLYRDAGDHRDGTLQHVSYFPVLIFGANQRKGGTKSSENQRYDLVIAVLKHTCSEKESFQSTDTFPRLQTAIVSMLNRIWMRKGGKSSEHDLNSATILCEKWVNTLGTLLLGDEVKMKAPPSSRSQTASDMLWRSYTSLYPSQEVCSVGVFISDSSNSSDSSGDGITTESIVYRGSITTTPDGKQEEEEEVDQHTSPPTLARFE